MLAYLMYSTYKSPILNRMGVCSSLGDAEPAACAVRVYPTGALADAQVGGQGVIEGTGRLGCSCIRLAGLCRNRTSVLTQSRSCRSALLCTEKGLPQLTWEQTNGLL